MLTPIRLCSFVSGDFGAPSLKPASGRRGAGDYIPGLYASLINITPNKPGFAAGVGYLFYDGSLGASKALTFGGIEAANVSADVSLADLSLTYTFSPTIFGAHYTVSASIPYVWLDVEAKVSLNHGLLASVIGPISKTVEQSTNGLSDIFLVPFALNWTFGDLQVNPQFFMVTPTGDYQKGKLANAVFRKTLTTRDHRHSLVPRSNFKPNR